MDEIINDILIGAAAGIFGSGGLLGLFFFVVKRYLQNKLDERDQKEKEKAQLRLERSKIEKELWHALGRLLFWINRAIVTGTHNGELEKAFEDFQAAEEKSKELDMEILAMNEGGKP